MSKKSQEVSALAPENTGKILWFQTEDGQTQLDVRLENETVWLSVQQIAYLFGRDDNTIRKHINNAIKEELSFSERLSQKSSLFFYAANFSD